MSATSPTLSETVEPLSLFDEPMLNTRYHSLLARRGQLNDGLTRLPAPATRRARLAREGDEMGEIRQIPTSLRAALKQQPEPTPREPPCSRPVPETDPEDDLRGQVEQAVASAEASASGVRPIVLSSVARSPQLRRSGSEAPAFVIETWDRVPLEEIMRPGSGAAEPPKS